HRHTTLRPERCERVEHSVHTPLYESRAEYRFASIGTNGTDTWRTHMVGVARKEDSNVQPGPLQLDHVSQRCASSIRIDRYYETLRASGLEYGASFRAIEMLQRGNGEVLTRVR